MDIGVFQKKLEQLCQMAEQNEKKLTTEQVRECFAEGDLETEQLLRVLQYLKSKGIEILGAETKESEEETALPEKTLGTPAPLTGEEEQYLQDYLEGLTETVYEEEQWKSLVSRWLVGDAMAKADLLAFYLPYVAHTAKEYHCEEIALPDLIQEGNIGLLMALDGEKEFQNGQEDAWIKEQILKGIQEAIEEQTEQKIHDDVLVSRVEKLESAVKDLTDEEDGELKFSVAELAVILDMKEDEIRDVLRLTGDDK